MNSVAPKNYSKTSLVMPLFNQGTYLASVIKRVLSHKYPHLEILMTDGGSSDQPASVIKRYATQMMFRRSDFRRRAGGINSKLYYIMGFDLFYRMSKFGRFKKVSLSLGCACFRHESKVSNTQELLARTMAEAKIKYGLKEPGYIMSRLLNRFDRFQFLLYRRLFRPHSDPDQASD